MKTEKGFFFGLKAKNSFKTREAHGREEVQGVGI